MFRFQRFTKRQFFRMANSQLLAQIDTGIECFDAEINCKYTHKVHTPTTLKRQEGMWSVRQKSTLPTYYRAVVRSKLLEGPVLMDPENFGGARWGASIDFQKHWGGTVGHWLPFGPLQGCLGDPFKSVIYRLKSYLKMPLTSGKSILLCFINEFYKKSALSFGLFQSISKKFQFYQYKLQ